MARMLFDTNVVLDVLLNRPPWAAEAIRLWRANEAGAIVGYVTASSLTDIFYVACRIGGRDTAHRAVRVCLDAFEICPVDRRALEQAAALPGNDFEDNLQMVCASQMALDAIVTRDVQGFNSSPVPVLTPAEAIARFGLSLPADDPGAATIGE